jgi:murein L,D-transpeptidase YafK
LSRHRGFVRTLTASAAVAITVALAGCQTDELAQIPGRAMQPLSRDLQALVDKKNMSVESPILVRIFKEESELEVWKKDSSGQFALLKTYPICRWSGDLGPKVKQGDRQAPEGYYTITPGQMNPNSKYYLAFNLGFPNAYDKAHGYSGAFLMVHGDCSSSGCYSMSDDQMAEIYALGREAFLGGQKAFQVQAYPFRMTALNMARHRNSPHMAFWRMLKEGNDHFEVTRQEPKVDVCNARYVYNATPVSGVFSARGTCPSYRVPEEIAAAVKEKREQDDQQLAALVNRGVQTAAATMDADGGMHPVFVAKLQPQTVIDTTGRPAAYTKPGSGLPTLVRLPRALEADTTSSIGGRPVFTRVASADPSQPVAVAQIEQSTSSSGNFFTRLFGGGSPPSEPSKQDTAKKDPATAAKAKPQAKPAQAPAPTARVVVASAPGAVRPTSPQSAAVVAGEPARVTSRREAAAAPKADGAEIQDNASAYAGTSPAASPQLMPGAQPVLTSSGFESRWNGMR